MTKKHCISIVIEELRKRNIEVSFDVTMLIINLFLELIQRETARGVPIKLFDFGAFTPHLSTRNGALYWMVRFSRSITWRKKCRIRKGVPVKKYGVEANKNNELTKEAAEKGQCPICGAELSGSPPICPEHGSKPFERRPDDEAEKG